LETLNDRLEKASQSKENKDGMCSIRYRLGDLLHLENKSPIAPETVLKELGRLNKVSSFSRTEIFSDSPSCALELLDPYGLQNMNAPDVDMITVFTCAIQAAYFLGSSSKVSFWIAGIRSVVFDRQSSIPACNRREMAGLLKNDFKHVHLYDV
jgi:hypothetical protein